MSNVDLKEVTPQERREEIVNLLKGNRCKVVFTKVDGTKREMLCTLMEEFLPERTETPNGKTKKFNPDVLPVFDLDKQAWRSFRIDSLEMVTPLQ